MVEQWSSKSFMWVRFLLSLFIKFYKKKYNDDNTNITNKKLPFFFIPQRATSLDFSETHSYFKQKSSKNFYKKFLQKTFLFVFYQKHVTTLISHFFFFFYIPKLFSKRMGFLLNNALIIFEKSKNFNFIYKQLLVFLQHSNLLFLNKFLSLKSVF